MQIENRRLQTYWSFVNKSAIFVLQSTIAVLIPTTAFAQFYAHPLFVETARDYAVSFTGSPRSVALGGQSAIDAADAAMLAPSAMLMTRGPQIAVWGGLRGYRRIEPRWTPALLTVDLETRQSDRQHDPLVGAVIATRGVRWAVAGFMASEGTRHEFLADRNRLSQFFAHGSASWVDGVGSATVDVGVRRFGAALAVSPVRRVSLGASVYVVRLHHLVSADLETTACGFLAGMPTQCGPALEDRAFSQISAMSSGAALSASVGDERLSVTGRWNHEPAFPGVRSGFEIRMNLPDTLAVSVRGAVQNTVVAAEIAREIRKDVFEANPDAPEYCALARIPDCPGWGFGEHELADAMVVRAAIEQHVPRTPVSLLAGYATSPSRIVRLGGDRGVDDGRRMHRVTAGVTLRASARGAIDIAAAYDRHELLILAGYRFTLR